MKKAFKFYGISWLILMVIFSAVSIIIVGKSTSGLNEAFWLGYGLIAVSMVGQLLCAFAAFKETNRQKFFYSIPIIDISYTALIVSIIIGAVFMLVPGLPMWIGGIITIIIFGFSALSVVMASGAAAAVSDIDDNMKAQTFFIKALTVDAQALMSRAMTDEAKRETKRVYEAIRYSDPMSSDALSSVENQIQMRFNEFSDAIVYNKPNVSRIANDIVILLDDRNKKCKLLK